MSKYMVLNLCFVVLVILFSGCRKEQPEQMYDLPGIETSISRLQISPLAHDRARVSLKGIVAGISDTDVPEQKEIIISDLRHNMQRLLYEGELDDIQKGDLVLISGIFDRSTATILTDRIMEIPVEE